MTARWSFVAYAGQTSRASEWAQVADLSSAVNRRVTLKLDGTHQLSFSLNGLSDDATYVHELQTDVVAFRNGTATVRNRVTSTQDQLDSNGHTVSVGCASYPSLLTRRLLFGGDPELTQWSTTVAAPAVEQADIAMQLINRTQSRPGGDLGITAGYAATGVSRNRTYTAGSDIGSLIQNLSAVTNGFNWDIDPALVFRVFYPQRGGGSNYLLDLGGVVQSVQRSVSSEQYTNRLRFNGGQTTDNTGLTVAAPFATAVGSIGVEGSWETNLTDSSVIDVSEATQTASAELAARGQILPAYSVMLNTEIWDLADFGLGDTGRLTVNSGRLSIDTNVRCIQLDFDIDNDGYERVTATLGRLTPTQQYYQRQLDQAKAIGDLGRH